MEGMLKIVLNDIVNWQTRKWSNFTKVPHLCLDDHQWQQGGTGISWRINCQKFVRKLFGNISIWHELDDVTPCGLWTSLQRSVTNWIRACDKRLARLISYLHHTNDCRQCCHVGNAAQHCRLGLFQDSVFAGRRWGFKVNFRRCLAHFRKQNICYNTQKSISERILCIFGSQTFVPVSWMCKKQTSVSHSSTTSEVISLDVGLRMDGLFALDLWASVIEPNTLATRKIGAVLDSRTKTQHVTENTFCKTNNFVFLIVPG